jgi:hypothetical protein
MGQKATKDVKRQEKSREGNRTERDKRQKATEDMGNRRREKGREGNSRQQKK